MNELGIGIWNKGGVEENQSKRSPDCIIVGRKSSDDWQVVINKLIIALADHGSYVKII